MIFSVWTLPDNNSSRFILSAISHPASEPASDSSNKSDTQPTSESANEPANQSASHPANEPTSQPASQATSNPTTSRETYTVVIQCILQINSTVSQVTIGFPWGPRYQTLLLYWSPLWSVLLNEASFTTSVYQSKNYTQLIPVHSHDRQLWCKISY